MQFTASCFRGLFYFMIYTVDIKYYIPVLFRYSCFYPDFKSNFVPPLFSKPMKPYGKGGGMAAWGMGGNL